MEDSSQNNVSTYGRSGQSRLVVGVTGAIASGKSLVTSIFAELGCDVIDADKVGHWVLTQPGITKQLEKCFGSDVLDPSGQIDRKTLARLAFADSESISRLNAIVHPAMRCEFIRRIQLFKSSSNTNPIILDAAILFETNWQQLCDTTLLVDCPDQIRRQRVMQNRNWSADELDRREKFHFSLDIRQKKADNTLVNSSSETLLREQVRLIHQKLINRR